jgi:hypothetical protein
MEATMTLQAHTEFDARTGRPLEGDVEAVETLTDTELEREITLAALTSRRSERFDDLLSERRRRRRPVRG